MSFSVVRVFVVIGLLAHASMAAAEVTQDPPEKAMLAMMDAIKVKSYPDFVHETDDQFRAALTPQMFEGVSNQIAGRLKAGYKAKFLGKLRKGGMLYLWKLEYVDGKDESLVLMSVKDKKVSGFIIN